MLSYTRKNLAGISKIVCKNITGWRYIHQLLPFFKLYLTTKKERKKLYIFNFPEFYPSLKTMPGFITTGKKELFNAILSRSPITR
jgi:hypothetical protein